MVRCTTGGDPRAGTLVPYSKVNSSLTAAAEHNHYVQGVAWDPLNEYIATLLQTIRSHPRTVPSS